MPQGDPPRRDVPTQTLSAADRQRMLGWESSKNHANDPTFGQKVKAMLEYGFAPLDTQEKMLNVLRWSANPNAKMEDMPPGAMNVELPAGFIPFVGGAQALRDIWRDIKNRDVSGWTALDAASLIPGIAAMGTMVGMIKQADHFGDMAKMWGKIEGLRAEGLQGEALLKRAIKDGIPEDQARRMVGLGAESADEMIGAAKPGEAVIGARASGSKLPGTAEEWYADLRRINPDIPRSEIEDAMRQVGYSTEDIRRAAQQAGEGHVLDDLDQGLRSGKIPTALTGRDVEDIEFLKKTYQEGIAEGMVGDDLREFVHNVIDDHGRGWDSRRLQLAEERLRANPGPEPAHHTVARMTDAEIAEAGHTPERLLEIERRMQERGMSYDEVTRPIRERRAAEQAAQEGGRRAGDPPPAPAKVAEPEPPKLPDAPEAEAPPKQTFARPAKVVNNTPITEGETVQSIAAKIAGMSLMKDTSIDDAMEWAVEALGPGVMDYVDDIIPRVERMRTKWEVKLGSDIDDRLVRRFEEGKKFFADDWYETILPTAKEIFGDELGPIWARIYAYTSAGADAGASNITYANKGLAQVALGQPLETGRFPSSAGPMIQRALSDMDSPVPVRHAASKSGIDSAKLREFDENISFAGDRAIIDMWQSRLAQNVLERAGKTPKFDDPTVEGYQVIQGLTEGIARREGQTNRGFQAGTWAGEKNAWGELGAGGLETGGDLIRQHPGIQTMLPDEKTGILLPSFVERGKPVTYRQKYGIPGLLAPLAAPGLMRAQRRREDERPSLFRGVSL